MTWPTIVLLSTLWAAFTYAQPTLKYPVQDQLPRIARVNQSYAWSLLPDTFESSSSSLTYSTSDLPSWLSFDSASLAFSGFPTQDDEGTFPITLTASDGSPTETYFSILVSTNEPPAVHIGFDTQIANASAPDFNTADPLPSGDAVLIHPYYSFAMGYEWNTFRPGRNAWKNDVYYSAHVKGTTDLPSWLTFDNKTVTFWGVAPPEGSWEIVVTGSDYWGYTAIENGFGIQVSTAFIDVPAENGRLGNITTVAGSPVDFQMNLSNINVNGTPGSQSDTLQLQVDLTGFDWLTYDK